MTAHKIYGPKGVGALYVRGRHPRVRLRPILFGGGHERGMRSGTLNVPGIVGLGKAAEIGIAEMAEEAAACAGCASGCTTGIVPRLEDVILNGAPLPGDRRRTARFLPGAQERRLPGNLNLSFAGVEGEALLVSMKDVAVSSGSACTSASPGAISRPEGIGVPADLAHASIRFGLGRWTTEEEVDYAAETAVKAVERLREKSPLAKRWGQV